MVPKPRSDFGVDMCRSTILGYSLEVTKMQRKNNYPRDGNKGSFGSLPNEIGNTVNTSGGGLSQDNDVGRYPHPSMNSSGEPSLEWRGEKHVDAENCHRLYEVSIVGNSVIRVSGRVSGYGNKGYRREYSPLDFDSYEDALAAAIKTVEDKLKKGYSTIAEVKIDGSQ